MVVGCESGAERRRTEVHGPGGAVYTHQWMKSIIGQCKEAGVPCFVKQIELNGKVSKRMQDWPAGLRVRELPGIFVSRKGVVTTHSMKDIVRDSRRSSLDEETKKRKD